MEVQEEAGRVVAVIIPLHLELLIQVVVVEVMDLQHLLRGILVVLVLLS